MKKLVTVKSTNQNNQYLNEVNYVVPKNLNLEDLFNSNEIIVIERPRKGGFQTIKGKHLIKHIPYCYYLIDLIINRSLIDPKFKEYGYTNLRSELIDKVIPSKTRFKLVEVLIKLNVIDVIKTYLSGVYSYSYRLNSAYPITDLITVDLNNKHISNTNTIPTLNCIYNGFTSNSIKDTYIGNTTNTDITKKCTYIGISYYTYNNKEERGNPYVCTFSKKAKEIEEKKNKLKQEKTNDLINILPEYRFQFDQLHNLNIDVDAIIEDGYINDPQIKVVLKNVNSGDVSINIDNSVNRVFTPITNLKKEYRTYLKCKAGKSLISIDFKSSHIFHLIKLVNDSGSTDKALMNEINSMKEISIKGGLYEYVVDQHNKAFNSNINRQVGKELFIEYFLFGKYPKRKIAIWLKSLFPNVSKFITGNYSRRNFSIALQQSESRLLNNLIFKSIAESVNSSETTVFGIFDSVLVDKSNFDLVYNLMIENSTKFFGFDVPLTITELNKRVKSELKSVTESIIKNEPTTEKEKVIEPNQNYESIYPLPALTTAEELAECYDKYW